MKYLTATLLAVGILLEGIFGVAASPHAQSTPVVQQAAGNIDYVHQLGDRLPGNFSGYYLVTLSNEGVTANGEKNNGLYVEELNNCYFSTPQLDPYLQV